MADINLSCCHKKENTPVVFAAFTRAGAELALRLQRELNLESIGHVFIPERLHTQFLANGINGALATTEAMLTPVQEWAGEWFKKGSRARAIIFVSACGIAVRAIAPWVKSKTEDPPVIVLDERGQFVIPLLSGHIGGANDWARRIATLTGGTAFVTTATDVNGLVAVDEWAVKHDCTIENPRGIQDVSAAVLEGRPVGVAVTDELQETPWPVTLWLRPRVLVLGVGCVRDVNPDSLATAALDFLENTGVSPLSLSAIASIDLKSKEPALIALAERFKVPFVTFSSQELANTPGRFTKSERVLAVTGVDNVCERAAVLASKNGVLLRSKTIYPGITFALAKIKAR